MPLIENKPVILFDHEKLIVYQAAIEFVMSANEVIAQLPKGKVYLSDQLQRAALSIKYS